jgi:hypothetical protein
MMTFTTIIPKARNDGSVVSRKEMNAILAGLRVQFGGVTVEGEVVDAGQPGQDLAPLPHARLVGDDRDQERRRGRRTNTD